MANSSDLNALLWTAPLAAMLAACAPAGPAPAPQAIPELAGRTAGAPQRCVPTTQTDALRVRGPQTIVYGKGGTIWVNHVRDSCPGIQPTDILIVEPIGAQYCRGDLVRSRDPVSGVPGPACILGDFVPYRR